MMAEEQNQMCPSSITQITPPSSQQEGTTTSSMSTATTPSLLQQAVASSSPMPNTPTMQQHAIISRPIAPTLNSLPTHHQAPVSVVGVEDFKCNICLNIASDAVLTLCGHLFCWPCLYTWLHYHSRYKECPVCKGAASETRLIPIYSWGCKDAAANLSSKLHNNDSIPPRPPARRVESERQRRQRCHVERERQMDQNLSDIDNATLNQVLFGLNECVSSRDGRTLNNGSSNNNNNRSSSNNNNNNNNGNENHRLQGRETRASWLERLRAMREERLAWPVAFVHGLTSRELLQQRRQATELVLSPRLMNLAQDSPMLVDANIDIVAAAASYCQSGQAQPGALQGALSLACRDHDPRHLEHNQMLSANASGAAHASHTSQYLVTMSSILSSMEVLAKALELSSASSLSKQYSSTSTSVLATPALPHHLRVFNTPNEEQAVWQSSMRSLLAQMERLMVQLQSIQPIKSANATTNYHNILQSHWVNTGNVAAPANNVQPHHHHHHHHYHLDGSATNRSHMINPLMDRGFLGEAGDIRSNAINTNNILGLSPRMRTHCDASKNMARGAAAVGPCGTRSSTVFSLHPHGQGAGRELQQPNTSKSRKRWDVTRMSA